LTFCYNAFGNLSFRQGKLEEPSGLEESLGIHSFLNLSQYGLSNEAFLFAIRDFNKLRDNGKLQNT